MSKTSVVFGGTGGVGEGIVKVFMKNDFTVIVPSRSAHKLERLGEYVSGLGTGNLIPYLGSLTSEEDIDSFQEFVKKDYESIDIVSAALGGWRQGYSVPDFPLSEWNSIISSNVTSHFLAIKAVFPLLNQQRSHYISINGLSANVPYAKAGPVAMAAAAVKSLVSTLAVEEEHSNTHIYQLMLGPMMTRDRIKHGHGADNWYYPEEIADYIVKNLLGEQQLEVFHTLRYK